MCFWPNYARDLIRLHVSFSASSEACIGNDSNNIIWVVHAICQPQKLFHGLPKTCATNAFCKVPLNLIVDYCSTRSIKTTYILITFDETPTCQSDLGSLGSWLQACLSRRLDTRKIVRLRGLLAYRSSPLKNLPCISWTPLYARGYGGAAVSHKRALFRKCSYWTHTALPVRPASRYSLLSHNSLAAKIEMEISQSHWFLVFIPLVLMSVNIVNSSSGAIFAVLIVKPSTALHETVFRDPKCAFTNPIRSGRFLGASNTFRAS